MTNTNWDVKTVMSELESLGSEQILKIYKNHGAKEPLFGVTTGAMKPLAKKIKQNHELAMKLYATGNYDAMYFAGMIANPKVMMKEDFESWMEGAYFHGLSDYVVAALLAETEFAQEVASRWIHSEKEFYQSAGWSCYALLMSILSDSYFNQIKIKDMLEIVEQNIHTCQNRVRYAMNGFLIAVGISYLPLHEEALRIAKSIGKVEVYMGETSCKTPLAFSYIQKAIETGKIGYKRKKTHSSE